MNDPSDENKTKSLLPDDKETIPAQEAAARCLDKECLAETIRRMQFGIHRTALFMRRGMSSIAVACVGVATVLVIAGMLAQGLTASLRSSWMGRVAGISEQSEPLSIQTRLPVREVGGEQETTQRRERQPSVREERVPGEQGRPPRGKEIKVAGIQDFALAPESDALHMSRQQEGGYLPPKLQQQRQQEVAGMPGNEALVTVPVSQGRLLRFDEAVESVFIADPSIADIRVVSQDLVYVYGKRLGYTNMMAIAGDRDSESGKGSGAQRLAGSALLRVVADPRAVNEATRAIAPDTSAKIQILGERAVLSGNAETVDQAITAQGIAQTYSVQGKPPINSMTLSGSNQVNIRVRFVEVSRSDLKSFGIDFALSAGNFSVGLQNTSRALSPNIALSTGNDGFNLDLLIEALQSNGALTVLAEPNLTAVTGETASFLAGGEVGIPISTGSDNAPSVTYKPFGVSLAFTPTIIKENRIGLRVQPEVSSIAPNTNFAVQGFNLPTFTVRRASTAVEIASGQTFALAGLFQREISRSVEKLPVIGDVPIVGQLFRSERYQRNETELVILITPYLVEPIDDNGVVTPLEQMPPSSPWQARVEPEPSVKGAAYLDTRPGSAGFIMK